MNAPLAAEWKKVGPHHLLAELRTGSPDRGRPDLQGAGRQRLLHFRGFDCVKSQRVDFHQNGVDLIASPKRQRTDASYEDIDWDTAIREIGAKFAAVKAKHGGTSILYYGGGSQSHHVGAERNPLF